LDIFQQSSSESDYIIFGEIAIFHCLNCIFECINGFSAIKKPYYTWIAQSQQLIFAIPTIPLKFWLIFGKKWLEKMSLKKVQIVTCLNYTSIDNLMLK
jgi:hypothetical protein